MLFMLLFGVICNIYSVSRAPNHITQSDMLSGSALQGKDRLAPKSTLLKGPHDRATACHAHRGTHGSPPTVLLLLCSALGKGTRYAHGSGGHCP